ncbi:hypothetical protein Tco_0887269 [Tanacetum coccineum]
MRSIEALLLKWVRGSGLSRKMGLFWSRFVLGKVSTLCPMYKKLWNGLHHPCWMDIWDSGDIPLSIRICRWWDLVPNDMSSFSDWDVWGTSSIFACGDPSDDFGLLFDDIVSVLLIGAFVDVIALFLLR